MPDLLEHALTVDENICVFCKGCPIVFNGNHPLATVLQPDRFNNLMIEPDVAVKIPFLGPFLDIIVDLWTSRVKVTPVCLWVKRKRLRN